MRGCHCARDVLEPWATKLDEGLKESPEMLEVNRAMLLLRAISLQ